MLKPLMVCLLFLSAYGQSGKFGVFSHAADGGNPTRKGSTEFDSAKGEYRMSGSGANMWAKEDQFQYAWNEMRGNVAVTATLKFVGEGAAHRKAGIMLRQTLDTDSPYVDLVIHGNGMPGIQWRNNKGENTNGFDLPFDSPGTFKLKLVRQGVIVTVWIGKNGSEMKEIGHTEMRFTSPIMVGLFVCAHNAEVTENAVFSDVAVETLPTPVPKAAE
jgi:TolB protein